MKNRILLFCFMLMLAITACNKSTCPTFDENAGDKALKGGGKTKSGVLPKK